MALGTEIGLGLRDILLDGNSPPIFGQCRLWPNGLMDYDATWYEGRTGPRRLCVRCGPSYPQKKRAHPTQFLAYVYCGQTAGWMNTPHGTEVDLDPGHTVLDGVPAPAKGNGSHPLFSARLLCPWSPISAITYDDMM